MPKSLTKNLYLIDGFVSLRYSVEREADTGEEAVNSLKTEIEEDLEAFLRHTAERFEWEFDTIDAEVSGGEGKPAK